MAKSCLAKVPADPGEPTYDLVTNARVVQQVVGIPGFQPLSIALSWKGEATVMTSQRHFWVAVRHMGGAVVWSPHCAAPNCALENARAQLSPGVWVIATVPRRAPMIPRS